MRAYLNSRPPPHPPPRTVETPPDVPTTALEKYDPDATSDETFVGPLGGARAGEEEGDGRKAGGGGGGGLTETAVYNPIFNLALSTDDTCTVASWSADDGSPSFRFHGMPEGASEEARHTLIFTLRPCAVHPPEGASEEAVEIYLHTRTPRRRA